MIKAEIEEPGGDLSSNLTVRAARLARAYGEGLLRARRDDPTHWRRAALLWPLFTKEP